MTPEDDAQDRELLERYRRASDTLSTAPNDAVRAAILAEGRRVAEQHAAGQRAAEQHATGQRTEGARQEFDVSHPAANDSRWKITATGTAGAALLAALLFAPRLWESGPIVPAASSGAPAVLNSPPQQRAAEQLAAEAQRAQSSSANPSAPRPGSMAPREQSFDAKARAPKLESAAPPSSTPALVAAAGKTIPRATALSPGSDFPAPPQRQADAGVQSPAPAGRSESANAAPAAKSEPPSVSSADRGESKVTLEAPPTGSPAAPMRSQPTAGAALRAAPRVDKVSSGTAPAPAALVSAVASGDAAQTVALLDQGAAIDGRDELGRTPLMRAVLQGRSDLVRLLLDRGADLHVADNTGNTPLQQATRQNSREIIALLEARERAGRAQ